MWKHRPSLHTPPHSRGALRPDFASTMPSNERAQGKPDARRTRSLASEIKKDTSVVTTGSPEQSGLPCAIGFNGLLRALPGDRAFLPPSSADHLSQLDASVEASGPHDFAVRDRAARLA